MRRGWAGDGIRLDQESVWFFFSVRYAWILMLLTLRLGAHFGCLLPSLHVGWFHAPSFYVHWWR